MERTWWSLAMMEGGGGKERSDREVGEGRKEIGWWEEKGIRLEEDQDKRGRVNDWGLWFCAGREWVLCSKLYRFGSHNVHQTSARLYAKTVWTFQVFCLCLPGATNRQGCTFDKTNLFPSIGQEWSRIVFWKGFQRDTIWPRSDVDVSVPMGRLGW